MKMLVWVVVVNIQQRRPPAIRLHFYWRKFAWHKPTRGGEGWGGGRVSIQIDPAWGASKSPIYIPYIHSPVSGVFSETGENCIYCTLQVESQNLSNFCSGEGILPAITWVCFTVFHRDPCSIGKVAMHGGRYTVLETWFEVLNKRQRWSLNKKNLVSIIDDQIEALSSQTFSVNDFNE